MMKILKNQTGKSGLGSLVTLLLIVGAGYVGLKMGEPYFAYMDLVKTMEYWAEYDLKKGDLKYTSLMKNVQEAIDENDIPLDANELKIVYNTKKRRLIVSAEYDVYVEFPGYEHHYHFTPEAIIQN